MTKTPTPCTHTNEAAQASSPSLAVTGASGNVGGVAARLLSERGLPLRLLANTPSRAPKLPGAHAVQCSYEDTPASREALSGVDVLFMVSAPESEDRLDKHLAFVDAAAASGVRHIVYLSFMNAAPDATFTLARTHFHTEERIKASGMTYTFLRDNFYADFFVALPDEEGRILGPAGDGRVGVVAREDAGRVAAGVLADPARYENQTLDVTGPEALTLEEITQILTRVWGRPVTYVRETVEEAYESRKKWPAAQWQYDSWVSTYTSIARGEMDVVSTTVRDVTGRDPLTFEEAYRPKRVGFGLVGFVPGSAVVEVGPVNCGSPPVDLGLCLGAVAGLVELVNDLLVSERGFKDVCWGGRELGVQVAPPQHGLDLVIKTHATVGS